MNECLTTPQHEKQIGYWVSEKGKCMKWFVEYVIINVSIYTEGSGTPTVSQRPGLGTGEERLIGTI